MADPATILAALRKFGIPEWILVDEDWNEFVEFLKENISSANILTDEELVELARQKCDKNGNGITIAERMDNIADEYEGIWSISEDDIVELEKHIKIISQKEEEFDDLIAKAKAANLDAIEDLTVLNGKNVQFLSEDPTVKDECLRLMEELQEVKLSNERKISELRQLYSKPVKNPIFMHQMPLNDYFRQLEQFNTNANYFIQRNFKVQDTEEDLYADDNDLDEKSQLLTQLGIVADRLLNAYNKMYMAEMDFSAKNTLTNQFKAQEWSPSTLMGMGREISQMERDNELNDSQKLNLVYKLQEQAAELAQLDVESLVYESNQKRIGRAKQRMEYLRRFADIASETMTLSEVFWVLMQLDLERMKNRNDYDSKLDAYRMESLACNRRIELINMIGKLSDDSMIHCYCNCLMELLHVNQNGFEGSLIEKVFKCIFTVDEFRTSISKYIESTDDDIHAIWNKFEFFKKASTIEEILAKFLYDGPVAKPQQYSAWYRMKKSYFERELKMICEMNELKKEECSYIIKRWSNDKYWRQKQVLWVWFLTEPKKVIKSLSLISFEAQQQSKNVMPAPRPIAGIVRKS